MYCLEEKEIIKPLGSHFTPMVDAILELTESLTWHCSRLKILTLQSLPKYYYSTRDLNITSSSLLKLEIYSGTYLTSHNIISCKCP